MSDHFETFRSDTACPRCQSGTVLTLCSAQTVMNPDDTMGFEVVRKCPQCMIMRYDFLILDRVIEFGLAGMELSAFNGLPAMHCCYEVPEALPLLYELPRSHQNMAILDSTYFNSRSLPAYRPPSQDSPIDPETNEEPVGNPDSTLRPSPRRSDSGRKPRHIKF